MDWIVDKAVNFVIKRIKNMNNSTQQRLVEAINQEATDYMKNTTAKDYSYDELVSRLKTRALKAESQQGYEEQWQEQSKGSTKPLATNPNNDYPCISPYKFSYESGSVNPYDVRPAYRNEECGQYFIEQQLPVEQYPGKDYQLQNRSSLAQSIDQTQMFMDYPQAVVMNNPYCVQKQQQLNSFYGDPNIVLARNMATNSFVTSTDPSGMPVCFLNHPPQTVNQMHMVSSNTTDAAKMYSAQATVSQGNSYPVRGSESGSYIRKVNDRQGHHFRINEWNDGHPQMKHSARNNAVHQYSSHGSNKDRRGVDMWTNDVAQRENKSRPDYTHQQGSQKKVTFDETVSNVPDLKKVPLKGCLKKPKEEYFYAINHPKLPIGARLPADYDR